MTPDELPQLNASDHNEITAQLERIQPKPGERFYRRMADAPWAKTQAGGLSMQTQLRRLVGVALMTIFLVIILSIPLWIQPLPATVNSPIGTTTVANSPMPEVTSAVALIDDTLPTETISDIRTAQPQITASVGFLSGGVTLSPGVDCADEGIICDIFPPRHYEEGSIEEMETLAGFRLIQPAFMPEGYFFQTAIYDPDTQGISALYVTQSAIVAFFPFLEVTQQKYDYISRPPGEFQTVQLGNIIGNYREIDSQSVGDIHIELKELLIHWEQNGFYYQVSWSGSTVGAFGTLLSKDDLIAIAESMTKQMNGSDLP